MNLTERALAYTRSSAPATQMGPAHVAAGLLARPSKAPSPAAPLSALSLPAWMNLQRAVPGCLVADAARLQGCEEPLCSGMPCTLVAGGAQQQARGSMRAPCEP